ncbi:MAG TPA: pyrimidine reductase family protein [Acidimicrobiia bacterium]|nr:pyrimidine reductase family protein [Acidimicrobiia bacterium]
MPPPASSPDQPILRELFPVPGDADLHALYRPTLTATHDRHVRVNMISSVDGGSSRAGTSGSLGGTADRLVFTAIRSFADVIVVGAGTMRAEGYGPARLGDPDRRARVERGQSPVPPIAVVTQRVDLDWAAPFFAAAEAAPLIVTAAASRTRVPAEAPVAAVLLAGTDRVDLTSALAELSQRGYRRVLVEGGPTINGELAAADAVDELCLTVAPTLLGGPSSRIVRSGDEGPAPAMRLESVVTADGFLFLRYGRERPPAPPSGSGRPDAAG